MSGSSVRLNLSCERLLPATKRRGDRETLRKRPRKYTGPHPIGIRVDDLSAADVALSSSMRVILRIRQQRELLVLTLR